VPLNLSYPQNAQRDLGMFGEHTAYPQEWVAKVAFQAGCEETGQPNKTSQKE
jgi:hypothetical protein